MKRILTTLAEKWPEYLVEGIVIVASILIAIGLENWNEQRKESNEELQVLEGLREEFDQNLKELAKDHRYNQISLIAAKTILNNDGKSMKGSKVDSLLGHAMNFAVFDARRGKLNEIISSGRLQLIKDESLRKKLTQWSGELGSIEEDIIIRREHFLNVFVPICSRYISLRNTDFTQVREDYFQKEPLNSINYPQKKYDQLLSSSEFDGQLYLYYMNQTFVFHNEEKIGSLLQEISDMIDQNIKKH